MNIMNIYKIFHAPLLAVLATLLALTACHNDDPQLTPPAKPAIKPTLPSGKGAAVKQIKHNGEVGDCYDWTLAYADGRLASASGMLRRGALEDDMSYAYALTFAYDAKGVTIAHSKGESISVTLNASGCIESMKAGLNEYTFTYTDGWLTGWSKIERTSSLGQVTRYYSSGTIGYEDGDLKTIVYLDTKDRVTKVTLTPSADENINGLLPETVTREMGIEGYEALYYGGFIGKAPAHLTASVTKKAEDSDTPTTTNFVYTRRGENTVLCTYNEGRTTADYAY